MKKLIIENLEIINFRNLSNTSLVFNPGYNEISGANGLGKTTVLDAIRYVVFQKNALGKEFSNYKKITSNENEDILPNIKLTLLFEKERIILETKNNKWFINNIEQKNKSSYSQALAQKLSLDNLDILNIRSNPDLLSDVLTTNKQDKLEIRNTLITIVNANLPKHEQIDNDKLNTLLDDIEEINSEIKEKKVNIKFTTKDIEDYKRNNSDVKNWDLDTNKNLDEISLIEIESQIHNYELEQDHLSELTMKIKDINNKISNIQNMDSNPNYSTTNKTKHSVFKLIILSILTLGIYLFIYLKNKTNDNVTSDLKANNQKLKELEQNKKDLESEHEYLNKQIQKVDIDELIKKQRFYKTQGIELRDADKKRTILAEKNKQKDILQNELNAWNNKLSEKKSQFTNISKKAMEVIKNYFPNFELDLFNNEEKETVLIKENNIDLQFLNYANKMNIVYKINEFLKNKIDIQSFDLVDHIESINSISIYDDVQIIACRVTDERKLKLNEQDIN